jgi:archaeosine-15-forming tRNA-guanine transglycosylase
VKVALATIALWALSSTSVPADVYDGNEITTLCRTDKEFVAGYVAGAVEKTRKSSAVYCLPEKATVVQGRDVFCKFLQENPEQRHRPAAELLDVAFGSVWPCKPKQ